MSYPQCYRIQSKAYQRKLKRNVMQFLLIGLALIMAASLMGCAMFQRSAVGSAPAAEPVCPVQLGPISMTPVEEFEPAPAAASKMNFALGAKPHRHPSAHETLFS